MTSNTNEVSIDEIPSDRIKSELMKIAKKHLNSNNVKISIEHGSKKGTNSIENPLKCLNIFFQNAQVTILSV